MLIREAELVLAPGLNAVTGETGAGKTILAQAIGLLLGAKGDASYVGPGATEAYVEAELELPPALLEEEGFETLAELRPEGEEELVLARRIFADGRTRAYAWGRSVARDELAALAERLIAMSGQFEQRRLARPAYRLDVLDAFAGEEQAGRRREARSAWADLREARRRRDELAAGAERSAERLAELRALAADTEGLDAGGEAALLVERERLRHVGELHAGAEAARAALAPEDGEGAALLVARAARALAPLGSIAAELAGAAGELKDVEVRLRESASDLARFAASLEAEPGRLDEVEAELARLADLRRRFRSATTADLVERAATARAELEGLEDGLDPLAAAEAELAAAEDRVDSLAAELRTARGAAAEPFARAVSEELRDLGMGEGELVAEVRESRGGPGPSGADEVVFLIRPNPGLPLGSLAETASGGELSRVALAIAAVAGGETLIFDEIDAGIGGTTAGAVGRTLQRLGARAQVVTITHLPQIATLAERHFRVEKVPGEPTRTTIEALSTDGRRQEIERMLGGQEFLAQVR